MGQPLTIREWPKDERPRERLLVHGEHRLTNTELVAIILGAGMAGKSCLELGRQLLKEFKGLRGLARASVAELLAIPGIGPARACLLKALAEISRRIVEEKDEEAGPAVSSPSEVAAMLQPRMRDLKKEVFKMLVLDSQNRVTRVIEVEEGTVNYASPIIREVFHKAIEQCASSIVCVHNHPSGNPEPSTEDRKFTEALVEAGKVLQVAVLDHIIIGKQGYFSFADEGLIRPA